MRPKSSLRSSVALAAALCAALLAAAPAGARKNAQPSTGLRGIEYGRRAPDFAYDAGGAIHRLSDLGGKIVVVHFWATWCTPCVNEMPVLDRLQREYGDRIEMVAMNWHDPIDGRSFAALQGWSLPIALDPGERAARAYSIQEVPTTLVLLPDRSVFYVSVGEVGWDELSGTIQRALTPAARV